MSNVAFDTLKLARGLEEAGFKHEQALKTAEVFAANLGNQVVTKDYLDMKLNEQTSQMDKKLNGLDKKIDSLEARMDKKIDGVKSELKGDIAGLKVDIAGLKVDIAGLQIGMIKWIVPLMLGQTALVVALIKFLQNSPVS